MTRKIHLIVAPFDHGSRRGGAWSGAERLLEIAIQASLPDTPRISRLAREDGEFGCNALYEVVRGACIRGEFPITLGGDHRITAYAAAAVRSVHRDMGLLQFDAHHDDYDAPGLNHYTVMRALKSWNIPVRNVGVRWDPPAVKTACELSSDAVYVSLDVDYFAPTVLAHVGHPVEAFGSSPDAQDFAAEFRAHASRVVAIDVVEWYGNDGEHESDGRVLKAVFEAIRKGGNECH